jgi:hypothetical protein
MLRCVVLARTEVSEELSASIIRVTRAVNWQHRSLILVTLKMEALGSSETSVFT